MVIITATCIIIIIITTIIIIADSVNLFKNTVFIFSGEGKSHHLGWKCTRNL